MKTLLSPDHVIAAVCAFHRVSPAQIAAPSKTRQISAARQELMAMLREYTDLSWARIGQSIGGRDHTSVLHGVTRVTERCLADRSYAGHVEQLRSFVPGWTPRPNREIALERARRCLASDGEIDRQGAAAVGVTLLAVASILGSADLSDAEARAAALAVLNGNGGAA